MASFTKKVLGLAGVATMFAGMAFGQANCSQTATTTIIRAEGTTEQTAPITITCSTTATTTSIAGTGSLQIFLSPALPVTSKVLSTSSGATETIVQVFDATNTLVAQTAPTYSNGTQVASTVSGSTINVGGIVLPALGNSQSFKIVVSNIRVNATSLSVGSGVPPSISATTFISGSTGSVVPAALAAAQVAFAQNGLNTTLSYTSFPVAASPTAGANNFVICRPYNPVAGGALATTLRVRENFTAAFKNKANESSQVVTTLASNTVNNATRIAVNFTNVAAGVTLYVPVGTINSNLGASTIALTTTAAGTATAAVSASTASGVSGLGLAAVSLTSGAGTATFEIGTVDDPNTLDVFDIPVYIVTTANTVTASSTPMGISVSLSPVGSTVIPNFVVGSSTTSLTGSTFNACSTSLLFPFVTNQLGFDTGIAISNTSSDPFGTRGATAQAGICTLNFYGSGAPSPANVATPNVPTGTTYTQVLSGVASGFQGYIIAQCNFQYAHGFAFITNGVGVNGGLSQGYLAGVIPDTNQKTRAADPLSAAGGGTGETLGN